VIEEEILESVPKTMKTKAELLVRKMKADPNIAWSEKGEQKYKAETVRGSNVVDLVNDVLRKRKYFNPQGWETFEEALREANVPQDLILRTVSSIPMLFNLYKRPFCQTRSKALLMSPNITIISFSIINCFSEVI
jgi:hypothetical protein